MSWRTAAAILAALVIAAAIALAVGWWLHRRQAPPDEETAIYQLVARAERAIERRNLPALMRLVAEDYRDEYGLTKRDLRRLALQAARSGEAVQIALTVRGIVVARGEATVLVDVLVWLQGDVKPQRYEVTLKLRKQKGRWFVVSSSGWQDEATGGKLQ